MNTIDVTQYACPANKYGDTHHMVSRPIGKGMTTQVCDYCGKTGAQLREEIEQAKH